MEEAVQSVVPDIITPGIPDIFLVATLLGVLIFGITEIIKLIPGDRWKDKEVKPTWWRVLIRTFPIGAGCGMGSWFYDFPWGLVVGGVSGVLCALLYKKARKMINDAKGILSADKDE